MYAIFEDGSRQYRAEAGKLVVIDFRADAKEGDTIELDRVLIVGKDGGATVGLPLVVGAKVVATVVGFPRVKTVTQKFRRRKASKRLRGHTQPHLRVRIESIVG
jgi:large subunit ribosomal protein L21